MAEEEYGSQKISLYNSGVAQIQRLDTLWIETHKHAKNGELTKWNWVLDRIWCELVGDLEDDDKRKEEFESFKIAIGKVNKDFIDKKLKPADYQKNIYDELMLKEEFLRRLQNKLGKGTKLVDADEDMIE